MLLVASITGTYIGKTFLETFIEKKAHEHPGPSLKGTGRSETAGFSRKKYMATLYLLTAEKQISIAMEQGISYGLLRKWKTEESFKTLVRKHRAAFADAFIRYVLERRDTERSIQGDYSGTIPKDSLGKTPERRDDAFRDSSDYSPDLLAEILRAVVAYAQKAEKEHSVPEAFTVLSALLALISPAAHDKTVKKIVRNAGIDLTALSRGLKLGVIERVKEILLIENITETERDEACHLLTELEALM